MTQTYSTQDAYEVYRHYLALKRHFTSDSYDFVKYHGKVNVSKDSFENRKDKFFFYKLSKKPDPKNFLLANMISNPKAWVGDLLSNDKAEEVYTEWVRRQEALSKVFKEDLLELNEDFNSNMAVIDGQHPRLLQLLNMKRISLETVIILDDMCNLFSHWDKKISDPIIYPHINRLVRKTKPFISYDKEKMKKILLEQFA